MCTRDEFPVPAWAESPSMDAVELNALEPSLRNALLAGEFRSSGPWPDPGKRTRPLSPVEPLRLRNAGESFPSLSLDVAGCTGEGDVARYSMRSAASVSLGGCRVVVLDSRLSAGRTCAFGVVIELPTCGRLCVRAWRLDDGGVVDRV